MNLNLKPTSVSIIISVYNRKRTFFRALDSIFNQSFQDYEILVIDDGSNDNFHTRLFKLMNIDYRIKFIKHSNRKPALSLNTGIMVSSGKYITFLDSDDEYEKEHLSHRVKFMDSNKKTDLIYSPALLIGKEENMLVPDANNKNKLIHLNDCIIGATLFGKRNVFVSLEGFRNVYSYDSEFVKRADKKFLVSKFEIKSYIYYRNTKDSILTNLKKKLDAK